MSGSVLVCWYPMIVSPSMLQTRLSYILLLVVLQWTAAVRADDASDSFRTGVGFWRSRHWDLAAETFEEFLQEHPDHPRTPLAGFYLGLTYSSLSQHEKARERFAAYLQNNPNGANAAAARYRIGESSYYLGDVEAAAEQLEEYVRRHPSDRLIHWGRLQLGESLVQLQRWEEGDQILRKLIASVSKNDIKQQASYTLAVSLEKQRKHNEAVTAYRGVVQLGDSPEAVKALARAGTIRFRQEQYERAAAFYDEIVRRFPKSRHMASAALHSGRALFRIHKFDNAIQRFEQVPRQSPEFPEALLFTGMSKARLNDIGAARDILQQALEAAGDSDLAPEIVFERASLEQQDGRLKLAAQLFLDLADRWPQDTHTSDALFNSASLHLELSDARTADRLLKRLNSDFPESAQRPQQRFLAGRLFLMQDNHTAAREEFLQVLQTDEATPRSASLSLYYLARIDHEAKQYKSALETVNRLIPDLNENNRDLQGILALGAMSALELGRNDQSVKLASQFLERQPSGPLAVDALSARTVAYARMGNYTAATADSDTLIQQAADNRQTWTAILQAAEHAWDAEDFQASHILFGLTNHPQAAESMQVSGASGTAWSLFRLEQYDDAASAFRDATGIAPPDSSVGFDSLYMSVRSQQLAGQIDDALRGYAGIVRDFMQATRKTNDEKLRKKLIQWALDAGRTAARLLAEEDRIEDANQQWSALADAFSGQPLWDEILDEWAFVNLERERYSDADPIYKLLLSKSPDSRFAGTARLALAESMLVADATDQAQQEFEAIVDHEMYLPAEKEKALFHLITIDAERSRWEQVIRRASQFGTLHSNSPRAPRVQLLHADALINTGRAEEAVAVLQLLRQYVLDSNDIAPWMERTWVVMAEAALDTKDYAKIDRLETEFQDRFPDSKYSFLMSHVQGRRWKNQAQFEKAREAFTAVTQDDYGRGTRTAALCQFLKADTYLFEEDYPKALRTFLQLSILYDYPDLSARALYQAVGCYKKMGDISSAERIREQLIREYPSTKWAKELSAG